MMLQRFHPCAALAPFIREYSLIESEQDFNNTILPNVGIVLALRYKGSIESDSIPLPASLISGLRKTSRQVAYHQGASNLLVTFKEGGLAAFTSLQANEFFGLSVSAENLFPSSALDSLLDQLASAVDHVQRISFLEQFLLNRLLALEPDKAITQAIQSIKAAHGLVRIKDLAKSVYLSQDTLEKRFRARIGSTPRQFASVIRLQHLIRSYPSISSLTEAAYEAGYFDQSHFIKDFRLFTGQTPSQFFKSVRLW